mgnify:CR=1 FL=1
MKIAISCQGKDLSSSVDPRFGRAAGFIIYDTETENFDYITNEQNLNAAQGAGIQTAQNVAKSGAQAVITGHVGPKAFSALKAGKIDIYLGANQSVQESIQAFKNGDLKAADQADKPGHW